MIDTFNRVSALVDKLYLRTAWLPGALLVVAILAGCASSDDRSVRGREVSVRYGEVIGVERVLLPSAAPAGAMVGGFTGLVLARNKSPGRQIATGAGGAVLGGLATRALEGERRGYSYRIRYVGGTESRFITEKDYLRSGDCVAVERGEYANVRRVASVLCEPRPAQQPDPSHIAQAEQCHRAKEQLLAAETEEAIESASRKVSILCDF